MQHQNTVRDTDQAVRFVTRTTSPTAATGAHAEACGAARRRIVRRSPVAQWSAVASPTSATVTADWAARTPHATAVTASPATDADRASSVSSSVSGRIDAETSDAGEEP